ncbi:hypothetical protein C8A05DRAFT_45206 [Staphylotrichum tortipilum]|uniref:2EXR domain-containing protein n=1 Tax=Staphylotrichum tortipilum TaxID=2831512 RepID=A0AAN6MJL3_9PEZI|nr:hypothetical protein C8A05DRAFT_45206 [Staphylotrichum longicolle]
MDADTDRPTPPRLFNDVHFQRWEPQGPRHLRRYLWLACLRRHRMIDLDIRAPAGEDAAVHSDHGSQYYSHRNALGNIVSGRDYVLSWSGDRQGPAGAYSPLLWVSREARRAALAFYRVQLPFFGLHRDRVLYLNPTYDVVSIQPQWRPGRVASHRLLADLLHDIKAYDRKGQGVAHLALNGGSFGHDWLVAGSLPFDLTPDHLHPTAAASFTDMLQRTLRSVLFVIGFRDGYYRGLGEFPSSKVYTFHFAQTLPLTRREEPAGAFHWLDVDPRPGVEIDIRQLPLGEDPLLLVLGWKQLERAFGITRAAEQQPGGCDMAGDVEPRLYVCPRLTWPKHGREEQLRINRRGGMPTVEENGEEGVEPGPRAELARHLREEAAEWQHRRTWLHETYSRIFNCPIMMMPKQGYLLDTETSESMERLPCTAIGLWLFPAEAFKQPTYSPRLLFDLSPARPGLFLFEV